MANAVLGLRPGKEQLKGLFNYEYSTSDDLVIDCYFEFEEAERQTRDETGCDATCDLVYALVGGWDISGVLSDELKADIESEAMEALEQQAEDSKAEAAISRFQSRWED